MESLTFSFKIVSSCKIRDLSSSFCCCCCCCCCGCGIWFCPSSTSFSPSSSSWHSSSCCCPLISSLYINDSLFWWPPWKDGNTVTLGDDLATPVVIIVLALVVTIVFTFPCDDSSCDVKGTLLLLHWFMVESSNRFK